MSTLNVSNITDGTDTVETGYVLNGSAKAWVSFQQDPSTSLINSLNISSQTDDATGRTTSNFSSSFTAATYCLTGQVFDGSAANDTRILNHDKGNDTYTASAIKYYCWDGGSLNDAHRFFIALHGDLA